jgi:Ni2+-binding GTPase involved in maturation of urease and hydrogenase
MIGGFLGAGKTTSVGRLARWLRDRGKRVGLITNDQGSHLVDTTMLLARGFPVEEIRGGCFCCRFDSLVEAAKRLTASSRPEVFIAEPVGSCTDLVATVTYPLRQLYGRGYSVAPLSVLVDPIRAMRVLGLATGGEFSDKVVYIYRKQLEEADLILINKTDLLSTGELTSLHDALAAHYPQARIFAVSARTGAGLEGWFEHIVGSTQTPRSVMAVDYEVYADGEARLGWLNCTVRLAALEAFDGNRLLGELAAEIQHILSSVGAEVAHLKMTLAPENGLGDLAIINLVGSGFVPELAQTLQGGFRNGALIINLRAEAAPEVLSENVQSALDRCRKSYVGLTTKREHSEFFRPGKPQPTHRVTSLA